MPPREPVRSINNVSAPVRAAAIAAAKPAAPPPATITSGSFINHMHRCSGERSDAFSIYSARLRRISGNHMSDRTPVGHLDETRTVSRNAPRGDRLPGFSASFANQIRKMANSAQIVPGQIPFRNAHTVFLLDKDKQLHDRHRVEPGLVKVRIKPEPRVRFKEPSADQSEQLLFKSRRLRGRVAGHREARSFSG